MSTHLFSLARVASLHQHSKNRKQGGEEGSIDFSYTAAKRGGGGVGERTGRKGTGGIEGELGQKLKTLLVEGITD